MMATFFWPPPVHIYIYIYIYSNSSRKFKKSFLLLLENNQYSKNKREHIILSSPLLMSSKREFSLLLRWRVLYSRWRKLSMFSDFMHTCRDGTRNSPTQGSQGLRFDKGLTSGVSGACSGETNS